MSVWSPSAEQTIAGVLDEQVAVHPDKVLFSVEGRPVTYREADERSNSFAHAFLDLGVGRNDSVSTAMLNCEEIVFSWFACAKIGAIHVPMHARSANDLVRQLRTARCKVLLADAALAAEVTELAGELPDLRHVFARDAPDGWTPASTSINAPRFADLFADPSGLDDSLRPAWDEIGTILFTGGTTGDSKGVAMSHNYTVSAALAAARQVDFDADSVAFQPSPLFHVGATIGAVLMPLVRGGTGATELGFDPTTYWDRIRHHNATHASLRTPMVAMLLGQPPLEDDGENPLRYSTAPQLPRAMRRAFEERFDMTFVHSYACSECIPILVGSPSELPPPGRSGKPNPGLDVRLVDDHDRDVAAGEVGEFVVRPRKPCIMFSGYFNNGEATAKAFRNLWFHTGDLGRVHSDGWWSVVDRKGDELRIGDEVHSSFEIEGASLQFPDVLEAAVLVVDGPTQPEIKMSIRASDPGAFDYPGFIDFCTRELPIVPRFVELVDDFPRGAASRVQKFKLQQAGITADTWDSQTATLYGR